MYLILILINNRNKKINSDGGIVSNNYGKIDEDRDHLIKSSSFVQYPDKALIRNARFETSLYLDNPQKSAWKVLTNSNHIIKIISGGINGGNCLLLDSNGIGDVSIHQILNVPSTGLFNFNGYIKFKSRNPLNQIKTNDISISIKVKYRLNGVDYNTEHKVSNFEGSSDWKKFQINNIIIPNYAINREFEILIKSDKVAGQVWIDELSFIEDSNLGSQNYIENGWMDIVDSNNLPVNWIVNGANSNDGVITKGSDANFSTKQTFLRDKAIRFIAKNDERVPMMYQSLELSGNAGDELTFIGWGRTTSTFNLPVCINIGIHYNSPNSSKTYKFDFESNNNDWQILMNSVVAERSYSKVYVQLYFQSYNNVYFTGFQLYKNKYGTYYNYDDNNDVSNIQEGDKNISLDYDNNHNIKKISSKDEVMYEFAYDNKNRIKIESDNKGNKTEFEYEKTNGKNIITTTQTFPSLKKIKSKKVYDSMMNLVSETDKREYESEYEYDSRRRLIGAVSPNGAVSTFGYDSLNNLMHIETNSCNEVDKSIFKYNQRRRLTNINSRNGTEYDFIYYPNGELDTVKVNDSHLVKFTYYSNNGIINRKLMSKAYGNSGLNKYTFFYNNDDQVTDIKFDGNNAVSYMYNSHKQVCKIFDYGNDITKYYNYNNSMQIASVLDNKGNHSQYEYDNLNRMQKVIYSNQDSKRSYDYNYLNEFNKKSNLPLQTSFSYYNCKVYKDMDVISLNGSLSSINGLKPISYSGLSNDGTLTTKDIFVFDEKISNNGTIINRSVYGSYSDKESSLIYDLNLRTKGTISFWVKLDKTESTYNRYIFSSITKNIYDYNSSTLGLFVTKDYLLYSERGLGSGVTKHQYLTPDKWHLVTIRWKENNVSVKVDNKPFINYMSSSPDLLNCKIMIGSSVSANNDDPVRQLNGKMEMISFSDEYLDDGFMNEIYEKGMVIQGITEFDSENRLSKNILDTRNNILETKYSYYDENNILNPLVAKECLFNGDNTIYSYDEVGNITHKVTISKTGEVLDAINYTYDGLNRITSEIQYLGEMFNSHSKYDYDGNGNIISITSWNEENEIISKVEYTYNNIIKDQLTNIVYSTYQNGVVININTKTIDYQNSYKLNPTAITNYGITSTLIWEGRRLKEYGINKYKYNEEGVRISKENGNNKVTYTVEGNRVIHTNHDIIFEGVRKNLDTYYHYNENGLVVGFNLLGNEYFYIRDITGNINKIIDINGTVMVEYSYNAWGVVRNEPGSNLESLIDVAKLIIEINPFLFKGYIYDKETGLYLLTTRYYNPEWGRFINADDVSYLDPSSIGGLNLYAYCGNNPIMRIDPNGNAWYHWAIAAGIVVGIGIALVCTAGTAGAFIAVIAAVNGVASTTMAVSVLSFAFVGSSLALASAGLYALGNSNSIDDFMDQGNWGTVAQTSGGGLFGAFGGYMSHKEQMGGKADWNKIRGDYWKSQGNSDGKATIGSDGYPMVLHHTYGRYGSKMTMFESMTRTDHISLHRMYGYGNGNGGYNQYYQFGDWWWIFRRL